MTRRISSSRPMTGSSLPARAVLGQVAAVALERLVGRLGMLRGDALAALDAEARALRTASAGAMPRAGCAGRRR